MAQAGGRHVDADETLVEISTDKVDAEVPSRPPARVVKIHAAEGDTVAVGPLLAEISTNGERGRRGDATALAHAGLRRVAARHAGGGRAGAATEAEGVAAAEAATGEADRHRHADRRRVGHRGHDPRVGVKVGDAVKDGDTVVEISTDKVDMELPAPAAGTIAEILVAGGRDGHASGR